MCADLTVNNVSSDMDADRLNDTIRIINALLRDRECQIWPQKLCQQIKENCDIEFKGTWNCHVGPSFGSSFPYEAKSYFYGEWGDLSILLYKFP